MREPMGCFLALLLVAAAVLLLNTAGCGSRSQVMTGSQRSTTAAELESALQDSLAAALTRADQPVARMACRAPEGEGNRVRDLQVIQDGDGAWLLTWRYRNTGDYNQDGVVGIQDVTPLAIHFGEQVLPEDAEIRNSIPAVIDGSGNGKVGIEDVTPIAVNFGAEVSHYLVEVAPAIDGDYEELAQVPRAAMLGGDGRLRCELPLPQLETIYFIVTPVDSAGRCGIASEPYAPTFPAPEITSVRPLTCAVGVATRFEAEISGFGPRQYSWLFGEGALPQLSSEPRPSVIMTQTGEIGCSLTISTPFGEDYYPFTVQAVAQGAEPYITSVQPQSGLAHTLTTFAAEAGGMEPLTFSWDFGGAGTVVSAPTNAASIEVELGGEGVYEVEVTVSNQIGSDTYEFQLEVIAGLEMEQLALRIRIEETKNITPGDFYENEEKFAMPFGDGDVLGTATRGEDIRGYLEAISYYYDPAGVMFGFDDLPPPGKTASFEATLGYFRSKLVWEVTLPGYSPAECFAHDPYELPGELAGQFLLAAGGYEVVARLPAGTLGIPEDVEVTVTFEVTDGA